MSVVTMDSQFFSEAIHLANNNKYRIVLAVNNILQNMLTVPVGADGRVVEDNRFLSLLAKETTFPHQTMTTNYIYSYAGRKVNLIGDITYEGTWNVTFYNDKSHLIRQFFLNWMNKLHNRKNETKGDIDKYIIDGEIYQSKFNNEEFKYIDTAKYIIRHMFPIQVGAIEVDERAPVTIEHFTVEFSYFEFNKEEI